MTEIDMTIRQEIQSIIDTDRKAVRALKKSKKRGLYAQIMRTRRDFDATEIPLQDLKRQIQKYIEEDHCYR